MSKTTHNDSPQAWLWAEIARRFGDEAASNLHADYLVQSQRYNHRRHHDPPDPTSRPRQRQRRKKQELVE